MLFGASRRLRELEEELEKLKKAVATRDLDWEEMRARCKRLLDRTEKQYRAIEEASPDSAGEAPEVKLPDNVLKPSPDRLARIHSQLAARRRSA